MFDRYWNAAGGDAPRPWESDPDAWRRRASDDSRLAEPWPQLEAGPVYWMWLSLFEEERGIVG